MVVSNGGNYSKHIYMGSQRIVSKLSNSGGYFYHPDHLGSSSLITDGTGALTQHIQYVPFGEVFVEERTNSWSTPYKFNGKELDEETGLYYHARYYDPRLSVWLSVDPLAEKYPNIGSYVYCADNPVKYVDPDGRDWFENEKTGEIYYNTRYRKNDAGKKGMDGEGWKWMEKNEMFRSTDANGNYINNDRSLVLENGGVEHFGGDPLSPWPVSGELKLNSQESKDLMREMGFEFKPTQQIRYESEINVYPPSGVTVVLGEKIYITEKSRYIPHGFIEDGFKPIGITLFGDFNSSAGRFTISYTNNGLKKAMNSAMPFVGYHDNRVLTIYSDISKYPGNNYLINLYLKSLSK